MSGQAAKRWDQLDVDWVLTLHLGQQRNCGKLILNLMLTELSDGRKQQEISEKVKKLNEPGETVESIF